MQFTDAVSRTRTQEVMGRAYSGVWTARWRGEDTDFVPYVDAPLVEEWQEGFDWCQEYRRGNQEEAQMYWPEQGNVELQVAVEHPLWQLGAH